MKTIILLNPAYPYGKSQIYMGGALIAVGAQLINTGCKVEYYDLNITELDEIDFSHATAVGITVIGSPYIPSVINLVQKLTKYSLPVLVGGQVIAKLGEKQFATLFIGTHAVQIKSSLDTARVLDISSISLVDPFTLPLSIMWQTMKEETLRSYLVTEMTLIFSQGCHFKCVFCAAEKKQNERFKSNLEQDLEFLAHKAKGFGIKQLEFYTTSLDFFQNPDQLVPQLETLARIQVETGIKIKIRCLACMASFMKAHETIPNLKQLLHDAGLWSIGFGVDGVDPEIWKVEKKFQNKTLGQAWECLDVVDDYGITAETLLVMGFASERLFIFIRYVHVVLKILCRYENTMLRPYLAKPQIPGNDHWRHDDMDMIFIRKPELFVNLDFAACGSKHTDNNMIHRYMANLLYLWICSFSFIGRCCTSPLIPRGKNTQWNTFASWWNKIVPFDR